MRTEQEILKDFEELGNEIRWRLNSERYSNHLSIVNEDKGTLIEVYIDDKYIMFDYDNRLHYKELKLLLELVEVWGWYNENNN